MLSRVSKGRPKRKEPRSVFLSFEFQKDAGRLRRLFPPFEAEL